MVKITKNNYVAEIIKSNVPVIVNAGAYWCKACKKMKPILGDLEKKYKGEIKFVYLDTVNTTIKFCKKFGLRFGGPPPNCSGSKIPQAIFVKKGMMLKRVIGFKNTKDLSVEIDNFIAKA